MTLFFKFVATSLFASFAGTCLALEPTTPLASYGRQVWAMENGLPQNTVQAIVQGKDGFIWFGTEVGLVRFDGVGFQVFDRTSTPALPGNDVQCLLASSDGSLWIGTSEGLAHWKDGTVSTFTTRDGLPENSIQALVETRGGGVWVNTGAGLVRYDHGHMTDGGEGKPREVADVISLGPEGELWAGTAKGLYQNSQGTWSGPDFAKVLPQTGPRFLVYAARTWLAANNSTLVQFGGMGELARLQVGRELPGTRIQAIVADREGTVWVGTNSGLARVRPGTFRIVRGAEGRVSFVRTPPAVERLPLTDPLASASVLSIVEDREGDLWVGTESNGLQILRDQRFKAVTTRDGLASDNTSTVVQDGNGAMWVGTSGNGLTVLSADNRLPARTYAARDGLPSDVILSLAAAPNGDVWAGTPDGLGRIRNGRVSSYTSADGLPDDFIRSLLVDADGSLWIGTRHGLTHWAGGARDNRSAPMQTFTESNGLGSDLVGAMVRDRSGDLWVATFAGLSRLHGGVLTTYTVANGLSSNVITSLAAREDGSLLIGTQDRGWNLWDGTGFSHVQQPNPDGPLPAQPGLDRISIHAILDDRLGHLWFATGSGIARCDCGGEMKAMHSADCTHWLDFGTADGLISRETATNSHPSAWRSSDGRLWFATPKGLEEADPAHFPVNTAPPPVALERFAVDDVTQTLPAGDEAMRVPAGRNHFQFEYAGLSFVAPQKVRYRFMLEGFDRNWTEAGTRRTAYYTNIPPGHYTFRVQAANNDGLWNTAGAALRFELRPHFYQTLWFYGLLALGLAALVLLALRLRLLRAEREFRAVLGERNRIAREIHDTLAQGYVGISVQLEVLSELLRHNKVEAAARHLDVTRGYVREGLDDARQSIWSLRSQDATETTLPVRVRRLVEQADGHGLDARFSLYGAYRPMPPGTEQEILRVAQEAIHNVKKHAGAKNLAVQLEYGPAEVALEVRDDGRGFTLNHNGRNGTGNPSSALSTDSAPDSPPGHYGLTGMKERAAAINGVLEVSSGPGQGTAVRLRAPATKGMKDQGE